MRQHDRALSLAVGDAVVYASHGIGLVEARRPRGGDIPEMVVIVFESGLRVNLPVDRARRALRPLSSEAELEDVRQILSSDPDPSNDPWSKRFRALREKVNAGGVVGLAQVVRDGVLRDRKRVDVTGGGRPASASSERGLYLHARALLAAEIARTRGIPLADADAWIIDQTRKTSAAIALGPRPISLPSRETVTDAARLGAAASPLSRGKSEQGTPGDALADPSLPNGDPAAGG